MGYENNTLLRKFVRSIRKGDEKEKALLRDLFEASQKGCPHHPRDRKTHMIPEDSGRFKKGGTINYCTRCSGLVKYYPPGAFVPKHRPTAWEVLLNDDLG